jgi:hypothetical protein
VTDPATERPCPCGQALWVEGADCPVCRRVATDPLTELEARVAELEARVKAHGISCATSPARTTASSRWLAQRLPG